MPDQDPFGDPTQTFHVEIRFDYVGTRPGAAFAAQQAISLINDISPGAVGGSAEVIAIVDGPFDDV